MMDDELAEIRTYWDEMVKTKFVRNVSIDVARTARDEVYALLAEVKRLRAENAAMREIVQAVATDDRLLQNTDLAGAGYCNSCSAMEDYELHTPDCLVTKARALLAAQEGSSHDTDLGRHCETGEDAS